MWVGFPAGQRSKTHCKEDSRLFLQEESKGVGAAQSVSELGSKIQFVEWIGVRLGDAAPIQRVSRYTVRDTPYDMIRNNRLALNADVVADKLFILNNTSWDSGTDVDKVPDFIT